MQTHNWFLFYVLVSFSLLFSSEIILKQLFTSGSVNIYILLTKCEGRTGRISAWGLDSTDQAQKRPRADILGMY